jgi:excisionase family DNA binding protein
VRYNALPPGTPLPQEAQYYDVREIAAYLRCSAMSVYRMMRDGSLPARRFGRMFRIPADEFHDWERKCAVGVDDQD